MNEKSKINETQKSDRENIRRLSRMSSTMSAFDRRSAVTQSVWTTAKSDCNYGAHSSKINESVSTTIERQNKIRCHAEGKSDRFYIFLILLKLKKIFEG